MSRFPLGRFGLMQHCDSGQSEETVHGCSSIYAKREQHDMFKQTSSIRTVWQYGTSTVHRIAGGVMHKECPKTPKWFHFYIEGTLWELSVQDGQHAHKPPGNTMICLMYHDRTCCELGLRTGSKQICTKCFCNCSRFQGESKHLQLIRFCMFSRRIRIVVSSSPYFGLLLRITVWSLRIIPC